MRTINKSISGLKGQELNLENVKGGKQERSHDLLNFEFSVDGDNVPPVTNPSPNTIAQKRTAQKK